MTYVTVRGLVLLSALSAIGQVAYGGCASSDSNDNTECGSEAILAPMAPGRNSAFGFAALFSNSTGGYNTAAGWYALEKNSTGGHNTASGAQALADNSDGNDNTASGYQAMEKNTGGGANTANGAYSLQNNNGQRNTASGAYALAANLNGDSSTATGYQALASYNGNDGGNTADGAGALFKNTEGSQNVAAGNAALYFSTGSGNTAIGSAALYSSTDGVNNIGVGNAAGINVTTGSNNVEIGNYGKDTDSDTTRIGTSQTAAYIAGIYGTQVNGGSAVYVTASGQLGVHGSSERFKTHIAPMPDLSAKIARLRPVTFQYRTDAQGVLQYGLIAEEVDKVYPELVIRDDSGKIQGVRYEELAPMLLREVQKQQVAIAAQAAQIRDLTQEQKRIITSQNEHAVAQEAEIRDLKELVVEMRAGLLKLQSKDELLSQRQDVYSH